MLTLRTLRLHQSRQPLSSLGCLYGLKSKPGCRLDCVVPRLHFHINWHQSRSYLFVPVSWSEARERLERWLEQTESRIVKVSLLKRRGKSLAQLPSDSTQQNRRKPKSNSTKQNLSRGKLMKWKHFVRRKQLLPRNQIQPSSSLPLPSSESPVPTFNVVEIKKVYQRWKTLRKSQYQLWKDRREEQYQGWKSRRQAQYQRWKSQRQAQYQIWNMKRNQDSIKRRQVLLKEYSKSEWFDVLGRPLTSRDSTGRFVNPWQSQSTNGVHSLETILRWRWQRFVRERLKFLSKLMSPQISNETSSYETSSPLSGQTIPPLPVSKESNLQLTWIGHSTCLFQVKKNFTILTDPMFSTRASPYRSFIGVERDVPPAFSVDELIKHQARTTSVDALDGTERKQGSEFGEFDICCITHDHYDHMDTESVKALKHHVQLWVVPLGISDWLVESCSIDRKRIVELQWWQQLRVGKMKGRVVALKNHTDEDNVFLRSNMGNNDEVLTITCCPSSHWAGRTVWDRNLRLWCSFAFSVTSFRFFFCGDSGYPNFPLFRQIGDALGPFDLCCIPIGAYEPREMNKDSHCNPEEAVKIHKDLHSKQSVAIHWGSFQLTEESMDAPPRELENAICSEQQNNQHINKSSISFGDDILSSPIRFRVLGHGETMVLKDEGISLSDN